MTARGISGATPSLLHRMVEEQVDRCPDAVALRSEGQDLTYGELDRRANGLAHRLLARGAAMDVPIGLCLERSLDMVIGALGILKAGAAYVPIDPHYPQARVRAIVEDAGVALVVGHSRWAESFCETLVRPLWLDQGDDGAADEPAARPQVSVSADNLAYVIFTSGSTGRPKGVMNTHGAICNHMRWVTDELALGPRDAVLQKTPFTFDVSVWEMFWPLVSGARLVLLRPEGHRDPSCVADLLEEEVVTQVHFVPSMLDAFLATDTTGWDHVERVICSGEALLAEHAARFFAQSSAELVNLYGPTEAAVHVSIWRCRGGEPAIPIGLEVSGTAMYVLDEDLSPVGVGEPGELFIGGVQLARGYLRQPGLTAERFLPDPFDSSGGRMYRTGDRARRRPDGAIEYLGRLDHQVKLCGARIELGEIETALGAHPAVGQVVVGARGGIAAGPELVAYVRLTHAAEVGELRTFLLERLPDYMVPAAFVTLEEFPLTASGKVDRQALPEPAAEDYERAAYAAPRTHLEELVAGIFVEVLGRQGVGLDDDFFALGGHSLLATQVIARIDSYVGGGLTVNALFEAPTIAACAAAIAESLGEGEAEQRARLVLQIAAMSDEEAASLAELANEPEGAL